MVKIILTHFIRRYSLIGDSFLEVLIGDFDDNHLAAPAYKVMMNLGNILKLS